MKTTSATGERIFRQYAFALLFSGLALFTQKAAAQDSVQVKSPLTFSGFVDVFYAFDFNRPTRTRNIPFAYNHSRHNEFAVNLALAQAELATDDYRATLGLQAGTYPLTNYAAEPDHFRHVHNANAGVRLSGKIWLDAGIWGSSHIGFENAISQKNWTLTRSLSAENSPYYETGARLAYEGEKLTVAAMVLNGWQNIVDQNQNKALGTQITYEPSDKFLINHSTFFGNEYPEGDNRQRFFQNFHLIWKATDRLGLILGSDIGFEQTSLREVEPQTWNTWYVGTLIVRYQLTEKLAAAARGEYYSDRDNVIVSTAEPQPFHRNQPFQVAGYSLNLDYSPRKEVMVRIEGRNLTAEYDIFPSDIGNTNNRPTITTSLAVSF